ncbi:MAG: hypothetical protein IPJ30_01760 [Acidobacteria bacterium]|nr:hypothetical protein [Acidobacteriota bacterium]MBK8147651.1 hypothetical protein [Acidobacteriota bacterium]
MQFRNFPVSLLFTLILFSTWVFGQSTPEMSINDVKLGDRASARAFLTTYLPTTDEQGRTAYYFYNDLGKSVLKLTAASFDDPFMIVEIEVFTVGTSYQKAHNYLEKVGHFVTESKIFVGFKPSVAAAIIGVPNLARDSRVGPKDLIKKKGEPTKRATENERDVYIYEIADVEITDEKGVKSKFDYTGRYEFRDKKLKRFVLAVSSKQ